MKFIKAILLGFSMVAVASAYAAGDKKEEAKGKSSATAGSSTKAPASSTAGSTSKPSMSSSSAGSSGKDEKKKDKK